ncbi:hypothetical protein OG462_03525 [Streptomyces sp. NBC_01077]|uniref:hypothetical protein n=1 Tax=Streptomyces sp. NBC_01077 TaxID=2903746 RepID=UPI003870606F|nr:hypothetical protein OG462_03525 [Streptomyces sp. NBC_01077]
MPPVGRAQELSQDVGRHLPAGSARLTVDQPELEALEVYAEACETTVVTHTAAP